MSEGNVVNRVVVPLVKLRMQRGRIGTELYSGKLLYSTSKLRLLVTIGRYLRCHSPSAHVGGYIPIIT